MKRARIELVLIFAALVVLSASVTRLVNDAGWTLYYGDAEAHLNIARRIVDSRTPSYSQIGSPWLPIPAALTLLFIQYDPWWRNGLAGAVPSAACFVVAGVFLFAALRRLTQSSAAALASLGVFALNPNLLYLQATPMTEPVFLAGFMALLYFSVQFRDTQSLGSVAAAGLASVFASLSRYEGWFLIPFATLYFLSAARQNWRLKMAAAFVFGAIASLGPLYWIGHNILLYSNPWEFYNGPYSAKGIYQHALDQHMQRSPGDHDWKTAWRFYRAAAIACAGWGAVVVGLAGIAAAAWKRIWWPIVLTALPPIFYMMSMYSGGSPIFLPKLFFSSYYNTRYGLAAFPLLAIAAGCLALFVNRRWRPMVAAAVVVIAVSPWLINRKPDGWICWKESQVNSEGRRAWVPVVARLLAAEYKPGTGIYTSFGDDYIAVFREAGIPLKDGLRSANEPAWMAATTRPDLFLHEEWALAVSGDPVATAVQRATFKRGPRYYRVQTVIVPGQPVIELYKRD